jgi:cytidine deaminase
MGVTVTPEAHDYLLEVVPPHLKTLAEKKSGGISYKFSALCFYQTYDGRIWVASGVNLNLGYENSCAEKTMIGPVAKQRGAIGMLFLYGAGDMCGNCRQGVVENSPQGTVVYYFDTTTDEYKKGYSAEKLPTPFLSRSRIQKHEQHNGTCELLLDSPLASEVLKEFLDSSAKLPSECSLDILAQQAQLAGKIGKPAIMTRLVYANRLCATGACLEFGGHNLTSSTMAALAEGVTVQGLQPVSEIDLWGATGDFAQDWAMQEQVVHAYRLLHAYHHQGTTQLQSKAETADIPVSVYNRQGERLFTVPLIKIWSMVDPLRAFQTGVNLMR